MYLFVKMSNLRTNLSQTVIDITLNDLKPDFTVT